VSAINEVGQTPDAPLSARLYAIGRFAALIAVNLAVMNLLPIPALDGGRIFALLVTLVIEKATRRKVNPKYEGYVHAAGILLLLGFTAIVMVNDIAKLFR
jgi:regulator of sigma E protease